MAYAIIMECLWNLQNDNNILGGFIKMSLQVENLEHNMVKVPIGAAAPNLVAAMPQTE